MTETNAPVEPPKRKRGRENTRDMLLSLAVCLAVIIPIWYLGQPAPSDSKAIRPVDPTSDLRSFAQVAPGVPLPTTPEGWTPTSSTLEGANLRIGYVTDGEGYVEYAAQGGDQGTFLRDQTGRGDAGSSLQVGERTFTIYSDGEEHTSLVLQQDSGTVVVGGLRETAGDEELSELAATLR